MTGVARRPLALIAVVAALVTTPALARAEPGTFVVLYTSRATFRTDAPLETIVGTTAGPPGHGAVTGAVSVDPARPEDARGTIKVDLSTLRTGIDRRDAHMRSREFLDTEAGDANRYAVFEVRAVEAGGPLDRGKEVPARVRGVLTIKGKPVDTVAEARVTYIVLTPAEAETQKRFGLGRENLRVGARLATSFTSHGMEIPKILFYKLSNDIQLEADLILVRQ
jgi:polyisoprenoid-binding protein YceI